MKRELLEQLEERQAASICAQVAALRTMMKLRGLTDEQIQREVDALFDSIGD